MLGGKHFGLHSEEITGKLAYYAPIERFCQELSFTISIVALREILNAYHLHGIFGENYFENVRQMPRPIINETKSVFTRVLICHHREKLNCIIVTWMRRPRLDVHVVTSVAV